MEKYLVHFLNNFVIILCFNSNKSKCCSL